MDFGGLSFESKPDPQSQKQQQLQQIQRAVPKHLDEDSAKSPDVDFCEIVNSVEYPLSIARRTELIGGVMRDQIPSIIFHSTNEHRFVERVQSMTHEERSFLLLALASAAASRQELVVELKKASVVTREALFERLFNQCQYGDIVTDMMLKNVLVNYRMPEVIIH
jgi:hypothetical protein